MMLPRFIEQGIAQYQDTATEWDITRQCCQSDLPDGHHYAVTTDAYSYKLLPVLIRPGKLLRRKTTINSLTTHTKPNPPKFIYIPRLGNNR